jgi:hypothetical protein
VAFLVVISLYASWLTHGCRYQILALCYFAYLLLLPVVGGLWYLTAGGRTSSFYLVHDTLRAIFSHVLSGEVLSTSSSGWKRLCGWILLSAAHFFSERVARAWPFPSAHVSVLSSSGAWQRQQRARALAP